MVGRRSYDFMYRWWAPWDGVGVRDDLVRLVDTDPPPAGGRTVDLGCGTGANVVFLAQRGYDALGLDFSEVALEKARTRASEAGVIDRCRFAWADLTADPDPELGTFDLVTDFGTLDDLRPDGRRAMADFIRTVTRPGGRFLLWCFYERRSELPSFSFNGPSKLFSGLEPGEEEALFAADFEIEERRTGAGTACFVMRRR